MVPVIIVDVVVVVVSVVVDVVVVVVNEVVLWNHFYVRLTHRGVFETLICTKHQTNNKRNKN